MDKYAPEFTVNFSVGNAEFVLDIIIYFLCFLLAFMTARIIYKGTEMQSLVHDTCLESNHFTKGERTMNTSYRLSAVGNRNNGTSTENITIIGTLEEILKELETYVQDHRDTAYYSERFGVKQTEGYIWFDDRETGFDDNGGDGAIPVWEYGYEEDGDEPDYYLHSAPKPVTAEGVEAYAHHVLDVHSASLEEVTR